jgi:hypothetical protein
MAARFDRPRPRATNCVDVGVEEGGRLRVFALRRPKPEGYTLVNTTSHAKTPMERGLSPFNLGPIPLYDGSTATNMENAWQMAKCYARHADATGSPTAAYYAWARAGWDNPVPQRFPMGRGAKPLYSLWGGRRLGYISARALIYAPAYAAAVVRTPAYAALAALYATGVPIGLVDFDGWDHVGQGYSLSEVLALEKPKMGHAFVLAGLLAGDHFWLGGPEPAPGKGPGQAPAGPEEGPGPAPAGPPLSDGDVDSVLREWLE